MKRAVIRLGLAVLSTACLESSVTDPPHVATVQLTAAQAAAINSGLHTIGVNTPELAGLADSLNLIIKTGVVVDSAVIDVTFGGEPYYAVLLQRSVSQQPNPFTTFSVVYFNNPSSPTRFVILSVYARGSVGPPDGAFINLATPTSVLSGYVHFYQIDGSAVTHWRSTAGSMEIGNGLPGGACAGFDGNVQCETADLLIGGNVTATTRESGTVSGSPTLSITNGFVRGIKLKYNVFMGTGS